MSRSSSYLLTVALLALGCGSRGDPLPPLRTVPAPLPEFQVAQRGHEALVRFAAPAPTMNVDGILLELDRVELLMLTERYPAITADTLALALDATRRDRLEAAREATRDAITAAAEREEAERLAAETAGETEVTVSGTEEAETDPDADAEENPDADASTEAPTEDDADAELSEAEVLLRQVPRSALASWRAGGVAPETIVEAARSLRSAVDELWDALRMPTAIVDLRRPPVMPDPVVVIRRASQVARTRAYEASLDSTAFLDRATVVASIPLEELGEYVADSRVELVQPLGAPASGPVRTRYYFGVRAVAVNGREGGLGPILSLAPAAVPLPPGQVEATVDEAGVRLRWEAPGADISGGELDQDALAYNVYRRSGNAPRSPASAVNATPVTDATYLDTTMAWEQRHVYEVRALNLPPDDTDRTDAPAAPVATPDPSTPPTSAPLSGPRKEGAGAVTVSLRVFDTFAPAAPRRLESVRAGSRVTLRWLSSSAPDLSGYRIYRHAAPAPGVDMDALRDTATADDGPDGGNATAGEESEVEVTEDEPLEEEPDAEEAEDDAVAEEESGAEDEGDDADDGAPAEGPPDEEESDDDAARSRGRRGNPMLAAGWELLTAVIVTDLRYIDPTADTAIAWVYAVEAIDRAGNTSEPVYVLLDIEEGR